MPAAGIRMAAFTIVTIEPLGYLHSRAFDEIRLLLYHSLVGLGHSVALRTNRIHDGGIPILLGAHLLAEETLKVLPDETIIFNTEQLTGECLAWCGRLASLSSQYRIWDYSSFNLATINNVVGSVGRCGRFRLGYHVKLEKIQRWQQRRSQFVFFGTVTPYRQKLLDSIQLSDQLNIKAFFGYYGWPRDQILAASLAALTMHSQESRILEWPRIVHLLANRVPCIALLNPDTAWEDQQLSYLLPCSEEAPTARLEDYFAQPELLEDHAQHAWECFRGESQQDYAAAALDAVFASAGPAVLPPASYRWKPFPTAGALDPQWYENAYPWLYHDPRDPDDYHEQEGRYRQYHANSQWQQLFRPPVCLLDVRPRLPGQDRTGDVSSMTAPAMHVAVVLHFHQFSMARYFFTRFGVHLRGADFLVTTSSSNLAFLIEASAREAGARSVDVRVIDNVGRDIPSKYVVFNDALSAYDLCLFSHGKESDRHWFYDHNMMLAGSRGRVEAIQSLFASTPSLGLVFPDYLESLGPSICWSNMRSQVDSFLSAYGCDTSPIEVLEFPAGGFFWARPQALAFMHGLNLTLSDLPAEPLPKDGTMLHALERMPCLSCEMMGMHWLKLSRDQPD